MEEIAGWVAPIATTLAAMMTASNLGPRVTGWGFVVFVIASIAWVTVAIASGQTNLLAANAFLTVVNIVGVWRWLGRQARYGDGASAAEEASRVGPAATLFSVAGIADSPVRGADGSVIAHAVDAMAACDDGRITYVMVREGGSAGLGERLHALDWSRLRRHGDGFEIACSAEALADEPVANATEWPAAPVRAH